MDVMVKRCAREEIADLRARFIAELNAQLVCYSWLERGFCDPLSIRLDGAVVGYGLVGGVTGDPRTTITECYVVPEARPQGNAFFSALLRASGAAAVLAQSNDGWLSERIRESGRSIEEQAVLFADARTTLLPAPLAHAVFRRLSPQDRAIVFPHEVEPVGDWGVEVEGRIVGTGGILLHYNPPFADVHLEVIAPMRRRGVGAFLVQELKRECLSMRRLPAARCNPQNQASRCCLERAGMTAVARLYRAALAGC